VSITLAQHEKKLQEPALCELLPVRDYLDNVIVRTNGAFVAGYELSGLTSYFASDEGRDRGNPRRERPIWMKTIMRSKPPMSSRGPTIENWSPSISERNLSRFFQFSPCVRNQKKRDHISR
jgi:hypothetical protein